MSSSSVAAGYRAFAAQCVQIAEGLQSDTKLVFLHMAQAWLRLAEQAEKNGQAAAVYEPPPPRLPLGDD